MDSTDHRDPSTFRRSEDAVRASSDSALLAGCALALLGCRDVEATYRVIADSMARLCPGSVIIANQITADGECLVTRAVGGLDVSLLTKAARLVGFKLVGKRSPVAPAYRSQMLTSTLSKIPGGIVEFASSEIPKTVATACAAAFGLEDTYTIGISDGATTFGSIHMFVRVGGAAPSAPVIETFVRHCFSALEGMDRAREIAANAELYDSILRTAIDGFWSVDAAGRFLEVNDAYCEMSGYSRAELLGMRITDVEALESTDDVVARIREIRSQGRARFESRHRRKDGTVFDVEVSAQALPGDNEGAAAFLKDITARKEAERELRQSEERLSALFQQAPLGYQSLDENGRFLEVNDAWLKLLGYPREEVMGAWFGDFLAPEFVEPFRQRFPLFKERGAIHSEFRMLRRDGEQLTIAFEGRIGHHPDGSFRQTHCILSDITESQRAATALRESEERLRRAVQEAPFPMMIHTEDGSILQINDEWQSVTGYSPQDIPTIADWTERAYGTRAKVVKEDIDALYGMTGSKDEGEYEIRTKSGELRTWHFKSAALGAVVGGRRAVISTAMDVTDRNRAEDEILTQRDKIARTLTSVIDIARDIVEERDPYTAGHQRRVSEIAVRMAQAMSMPEVEVDEIRLASLIHDVGKVIVPTEILCKPGAISPMEYELLKTHAEAGHRILAAAHMDEPLPELVYQHHERCDGSGYPRGLTGDRILPGAKIIAVADVVEAMMSHRPYRPALGIDAALAEIERGSGSAYDSEAVRVCVALFREEGFTLS
jgi:PAS domain S-box-containing protein